MEYLFRWIADVSSVENNSNVLGSIEYINCNINSWNNLVPFER